MTISPDTSTAVPVGDDAASNAPAGRQCGRCRGWFAADPMIEPGSPRDWWACPPCHTSLFGTPGRNR